VRAFGKDNIRYKGRERKNKKTGKKKKKGRGGGGGGGGGDSIKFYKGRLCPNGIPFINLEQNCTLFL